MKKVKLSQINVGDIFKWTKDGDWFVATYGNSDWVGISGSSCGCELMQHNVTETDEDFVWLVREYK